MAIDCTQAAVKARYCQPSVGSGTHVSRESAGRRGIRFSRVDHVAINARDLDHSAAFYARVLALVPGPRSTFRQVLLSPALSLHLFQVPERGTAPVGGDWRRPGVQHVALDVDEAEFERAAEVLVAAGTAAEGPTEDSEGRSLYFRDPDGNVIELRSAWDSSGGE